MRLPALAPVLMVAVLACAAAPAPYRYVPAHDDKSIGSAAAPVTVIEYGSVACPHCAAWDREVFPAFKKKYIDTGKVRFVFREMLTGDPSLAAAGFVTARCAPPDKYFDVVHAIMRQQDEIYRGRQIRPPLIAIAKGVGLSEEKLTACLDDPHNLTAANTRSDLNAAMDSVDGTPAFIVNGVKLDGEQSLEQLDKAISSAPPAARPVSPAKRSASASASKPGPRKK